MVQRILDTLRWRQVLGIVATASAIAAGAAWAQQRSGAVKPLSAQDILEIQQLGAKYAYGLDTGADNGYYYANVFTADGSFGNTAGRDKLAALAGEGGGRLKLRGYQHIITNFIVEPTAEGAVGSQYVQVLTVGGQGKTPMVDHGGRYEDIYVRTAEGWRIKKRIHVPTFPPR